MKLFSVFVFIFTVDAVQQHVLRKLISQPRLFANTLTDINPGEAKSTAEDFKSLIATGEKERQEVIDQLNAAKKEAAVTKDALDKATVKRTNKEGEIADSKKEVQRLEVLQTEQDKTLDSARKEKSQTDVAFESATTKMTKENTRIDNERKIFETVIEKVKTINGDSVSDLQLPAQTSSLVDMMANADPEAIKKLIEALNAAIEDGEEVRASVQGDLATAEKNAKDAAEAVQQAERDLIATKTALGTEKEKLDACQKELVILQSVEEDANDDHKEKTDDLTETQKIHDAEIARIDGERQTFLDAIEQLEKLDSVVEMLD